MNGIVVMLRMSSPQHKLEKRDPIQNRPIRPISFASALNPYPLATQMLYFVISTYGHL